MPFIRENGEFSQVPSREICPAFWEALESDSDEETEEEWWARMRIERPEIFE